VKSLPPRPKPTFETIIDLLCPSHFQPFPLKAKLVYIVTEIILFGGLALIYLLTR